MHRHRKFLASLLILLLIGWLFAYMGSESKLSNGFSNAIRSDGLGYYAWTQFFLYDQNLCFDDVRSQYDAYSPENAWVVKPITKTSCYLPIYPFGLGILLIPFYLVAFVISLYQGIKIDPLSQIFQILISTSGVIFIFFGLSMFKKLIDMSLYAQSKTKTYFIIFSLLLGSNLFHYATYDGIFSHASSFFINSLLIFLIVRFVQYNNLTKIHYFLIGFLPLFGITIRPTNFTFTLFTFLAAVLIVKRRELQNLIYLFYGSFFGLMLISLQLLFWKITTGTFLYFTYYDYEGFNYQLRNIFLIFFSFNPHGLLPWSPILLLSVFGILKSYSFSKSIFITSVIVFMINTVIFASWSQPFGGGAFGNRLFIDLYPLLYVSFALAYSNLNRKISFVLYSFSVLSSLVTIHLTYQYWKGEIDFGGIPFDQYFEQVSEISYYINQILSL